MYYPKRKYRAINLDYIIENSLEDISFIKEVLETSKIDFIALVEFLEQTNNTIINKENINNIFHKLKPNAVIYKLNTKNLFIKYSNSSNEIDQETYNLDKEKISLNLKDAIAEIEEELDYINNQN